MSGIVGIISKGAKSQSAIVSEMLKIIKHRGDQYKNIIIDKNAIIGFQSDLNVIANSDGIYIFLDGLIYNSNELIDLIFSKSCMPLTDEEVLLYLYKKFGVGSFKLVNGDFAVVIWDSSKNTLFFLKYITNNKNIFYYQNGETLIFASEIKSVFKHPNVRREIDRNSINDFLTFRHIPAPYTLFKNVRRLKPATVITYRNKIQETKLDFFEINKSPLNMSEKEIIFRLYNDFNKAVSIRIDKIKNYVKNYSLFLSGGIDSTTILYFLNQGSSKPVKTYTIALGEDGIFGRKISEYFQTQHKSFKLNACNLLDITPKALWYSEYPYAGADAFQYYLYDISKDDRFIFWGQGAEEILFGRKDYIAIYMKAKLNKFIPLENSRMIKMLSSSNFVKSNKSKVHKLLKIILSHDFCETYIAFREVFTYKERKIILKNIYEHSYKERLLGIDCLSFNPLNNYSTLTIMNGFLSDVMPSMRKELLDPYMDKELIDLVYSIPSYFKIKRKQPRYLEKKMMCGKLPNYVIYRSDKDSWRVPNWIKENHSILYYHIDKLMERFSIPYNAKEFLKINSFNFDYKFWALFTLEIMCKIFLDQTDIEEPPFLKDF